MLFLFFLDGVTTTARTNIYKQNSLRVKISRHMVYIWRYSTRVKKFIEADDGHMR